LFQAFETFPRNLHSHQSQATNPALNHHAKLPAAFNPLET